MKSKLKEWLKRYLPAEILSVLATLGGAFLAFETTGNQITTALAATWAGNIVYFGYILLRDVWLTRRNCLQKHQSYHFKTFLKNLRALVVEFGVAELFDSFLVRPALMYYLPLLFKDLTWGILAAKFAADITFYVPAIISYEFTKKKLRNFH